MPSEIIKEIKEQPGFKLNVALPDGNNGYLRLVRADGQDAALLARWRTDHYDKFFTRIKPNEEEVLDWLKRYQSDYTDLMFLVEYPHDGPIGQMALSKIDLHKKSAELGRIIHGRKGTPKGIMQAASKTLIEWALSFLNLEQIYLDVFADNQKARNFYIKLGFCLSAIQQYHRTITSEGIERYGTVAPEKTVGREVPTCSVHRMILEKGRWEH